MPQNDLNPFELLLDLENRSKLNAAGLPEQVEHQDTWSAIGFKVAGLQMVSAVGDVNEIMHFPQVTSIPGTKPWVKGMANIRGNLVPIIDLNGYLGKQNTKLDAHSRVLIINNDDLWAGLLVDQVLGLKHFYDGEESEQKPELDGVLDSYLTAEYKKDDHNWYVFSMKTLAETPEFFQVSL